MKTIEAAKRLEIANKRHAVQNMLVSINCIQNNKGESPSLEVSFKGSATIKVFAPKNRDPRKNLDIEACMVEFDAEMQKIFGMAERDNVAAKRTEKGEYYEIEYKL